MNPDFVRGAHHAIPSTSGFDKAEAQAFIEFCVDLDNQDDRLRDPTLERYQANPAHMPGWVKLFDSRDLVAQDLAAFHAGHPNAGTEPWTKVYKEAIERAQDNPPASWSAEALKEDARYNGFGPYQSAWTLYKLNDKTYAIAIRGTVISSAPSVFADLYIHPVKGDKFLSPHVKFANLDGAALHSGFAHATFTLMLDERYGVLRAMAALPANSKLYIVGHSQGAAMGTLVHAFLYHGMQNATQQEDPFRLLGKSFLLKSYAFAQPKPGNAVFAAEFASFTQPLDNAIVINNPLDPVTQVPLTLQDLGDLNNFLPNSSGGWMFVHKLGGIGPALRGAVGRLAEPFVRKNATGYGYFFNYPELGIATDAPVDEVASSWNFTPVGHVIYVYGSTSEVSTKDDFLQHHAWYYRELIEKQL